MKEDELEKQAPFNVSPHGPSREHRAETAAPANAMCNANNQSLLYRHASLKISKSRDGKQKRWNSLRPRWEGQTERANWQSSGGESEIFGFFSAMKRRGADRTCMGKKDKNRRNPPLDTEKCCETRFDAAATAPSRWNEKKALFWRWKASHPRSVSKRVYLHMTPEKGKEKVKGIWRKRSQQKINAIYDIHAIPTQMLTIRWRA